MSAHIRRSYREKISSSDLNSYQVSFKESDLFISTSGIWIEEAMNKLKFVRSEVERYIAENPGFASAFEPVKLSANMPFSVRKMAEAAKKAGVGPMASVAGMVAEEVGRELCNYSKEVIVENGGDIFIKSYKDRTVSVYAADSPLSMKIGVKVTHAQKGTAVCASSGTVGHSVSFGNADAAVCISDSASLADAAATAVGNLVINPEDIEKGLKRAMSIKGVKGCLIIAGEKMGAQGNIEICKI